MRTEAVAGQTYKRIFRRWRPDYGTDTGRDRTDNHHIRQGARVRQDRGDETYSLCSCRQVRQCAYQENGRRDIPHQCRHEGCRTDLSPYWSGTLGLIRPVAGNTGALERHIRGQNDSGMRHSGIPHRTEPGHAFLPEHNISRNRISQH